MFDPDHSAPPFNPIPPVVAALAIVIFGIELVFQAGARGFIGGPEAVGWRLTALRDYGFFAGYFDYMLESQTWPFDGLKRFVTYPFIHYSLTHALFACVLLLALGNFAGRMFRTWAILVVFFASSVVGALVFGLTSTTEAPLFGAYPAIYGLLGLYTWALWVAAEELGANPYAAFRLVGILVAIQVVFILIDGRWDGLFAEIGGFATGFALATIVAPGGFTRLRRKLQGRR
ncbi:rhomboid family intramembrane serine protease [Oceanibium sediminis]|uniref:rhomboid family intramembrane serine protease n=1 Tax=Oceanibium sediminis TaxID=2026339 RepID=UPI000DD4C9AD|nr:rhomboid family intramembrane serine protease [Oceanibium sediminis]